VRIFGRREPLHERLAREGGLALGGEAPRPAWDASGIHGLPRARAWEAVVTVDAPALAGERARFAALPGGELVVEEGPDDVAPLAAALERVLSPPYRAEAVRHGAAGLWAVAGRRVELVELPGVEGEEIELSATGGGRSLVVDGRPAFGTIPALERPGVVVRARRLDGDLWEVERTPL
jgi:hypothetical protein